MCNGFPSVTSAQIFYYIFKCRIYINNWKVIISLLMKLHY